MLKYPILAATLCLMTAISPCTPANEHEQMMQGMMQMQRCITESVDANYLEAMAKNSEKMANSIEQLCNAGQRQEAQDTALDYAKQMQSDPNFQALQKCIAQIGGAFPSIPALQDEFDLEALSKSHVCDDL